MIGKRSIDQGTVIYGIRSNKYPECACYGVIITARCDIAQRKVPKYYYLVAVDAELWLRSACGYELAYGNTIIQKRNNIIQKAQIIGLNGETLLNMPKKAVATVIEDCVAQNKDNKKAIKKIRELQETITEYRVFCVEEMNSSDRAAAINSKKNDAINCIKEIDTGKYHHYYFLPQQAYLQNGVMDKGLVVDLLEIAAMPIEDAERIVSPHGESIIWDNIPKMPAKEELEQLVTENEHVFNKMMDRIAEHNRLISTYWMKDQDCFVDIEGTTVSPWCEHLMQRFSNAFIRIGIENPSENDYQNIVARV